MRNINIDDLNMVKSKLYKKFDAILELIETIPLKEWTIMHSLAYICHKYKARFGKDFVLSYDGAPSKSHEYKLTSRIWAMLSAKATDGEIVKNYIDWFYENYNGKNAFRSIGALAKAEIIIKYQNDLDKKKEITLTTPLPDNAIAIIHKYDELSFAATYGDLAFIKQSIDKDKNVSYAGVVTDLLSAGFVIPTI